MAVVRACVYSFVIFLCFHITVGKPMFGILWCELACVDDDDEITTTPASREPDADDFFCGACPPRRRRPLVLNPLTGVIQPVNPAVLAGVPPPRNPRRPNRINVNMWTPNNGGQWVYWPAGANPPGATNAPPAPIPQGAPSDQNPTLVAPLTPLDK